MANVVNIFQQKCTTVRSSLRSWTPRKMLHKNGITGKMLGIDLSTQMLQQEMKTSMYTLGVVSRSL